MYKSFFKKIKLKYLKKIFSDYVISSYPFPVEFELKIMEKEIKYSLSTLCNILPFEYQISSLESFQYNPSISDLGCLSLLKTYFDKHGSDKANHHSYHHIYASLFVDRFSVASVFEIGLGSNNSKIGSNMSGNGCPGSSLRAFRDFFPNATILGADVDKDILFSEDRISCVWLDQLDCDSLLSAIPAQSEFDLIIDDGLHSRVANGNSIAMLLKHLKINSFYVCEDIPNRALDFYLIIRYILCSTGSYEVYFHKSESSATYALIIQRLK